MEQVIRTRKKYELIKIEKNNKGVETVNARDLHEFLESRQQFSHWIIDRIRKYNFTQDVDFTTIDNSIYSPPRKEYHITIDMAKELSMVERNDKGKQARLYFIDCEKKLRESLIPEFHLPQTLPEALRMYALEIEAKEKAIAQIEHDKFKVEFYELVAESSESISVGNMAKLLNIGGRQKLFTRLRADKILMKGNIPYQQYIDKKFFVVKKHEILIYGIIKIRLTTLVTGKGQQFLIKKYGKNIQLPK